MIILIVKEGKNGGQEHLRGQVLELKMENGKRYLVIYMADQMKKICYMNKLCYVQNG